ncbi:MAG: metallophosphoesterase [Pseudomonadota bacterium]
MRVFAASDLHVDYKPNRDFIDALSTTDYQRDLLIVAGDLSHDVARLEAALGALRARFQAVWFVPGNHDLWVDPSGRETSLDKHHRLKERLHALDIRLEPGVLDAVEIVPLLSWYDYSFGTPNTLLNKAWRDFRRCRWPDGWHPPEVSAAFDALNPEPTAGTPERLRITVSHFMPRADLLPRQAVERYGFLLPVLGGESIERTLRRHQPSLHVYGHSHVPVDKIREGVRYINNAKGYPSEYRYADRRLKRIV